MVTCPLKIVESRSAKVIEPEGKVIVPPDISSPLEPVIKPLAVMVPVETLPKLPVIVGLEIVGDEIVGLDIVGEVANTKSPVPVELDTLLTVKNPHSLAVPEVACSTLYWAEGVVWVELDSFF